MLRFGHKLKGAVHHFGHKIHSVANHFGRKLGHGIQAVGQKIQEGSNIAGDVLNSGYIPGVQHLGEDVRKYQKVGKALYSSGQALIGGNGGFENAVISGQNAINHGRAANMALRDSYNGNAVGRQDNPGGDMAFV
jgi:hypothetical protein